ncbi:UDP-glucuronosyltransferase 3A1-like isoform X1 [Lineus longissimus]|uniref:UDP-glucuronosyltransferase 3A1-like isoform X1 n=1 Tax=Lineus longissimus TaxID=88925 RepID=UPI00315C74CA
MAGLLLVVLFAIVDLGVKSSKILMLPYGTYSHTNLNAKLGQALVKDGHEVWMLGFDMHEDEMKKRGLIPLTFPLKPEDDLWTKFDKWTEESPTGEGVMETWLSDKWWLMSHSRICDQIMQNDTITATISEQKFDLVIHDGIDEVLCLLMIPYRFDIPFVTMHGFQVASWSFGVTGMPSIEPEVGLGFSNRMDFWQRLENLKLWLKYVDNFYYDLYSDHHMNSYCPTNKPKIPLKKVAESAEMFLMNFEVMCMDYPRVSAPNMQYLGTGSATPVKPLPTDLEEYLAGAEHGVVLMSLGSIKCSHNVWRIIGEKIFEAFGRLKQRVIVQYRLDEVYGKVPGNVKLMKWLPQNDILGHKNMKLFVMHGGNNGQNEAVYHGVPMLVIPTFFDQIYNGKRVEVHNYGKFVKDKEAVSSSELYEIMSEIINNETYSKNIKKCSAIIRSLPSAQEKFVFWVNHVLKFGGAHLRPPSLDMPLYEVLMLDIVAYYVIYYLVIVHVAVFVLYFAVKHFLQYLKNLKTKKE